MKMRNYFDLTRFWLLMKLELFKSLRGIAMTLIITVGLLFFVGLVLSVFVEKDVRTFEHYQNYTSSLLLGGFVLSSLAFSGLSDSEKRHSYLTLPVSALEKFICMWLLTSIGWVFLFTIVYTLYTQVANPVAQVFFPYITFKGFDPFDGFVIASIKYYFVLQGIFLVGAVHFKGYALAKTLFILFVVALFLILIMYVTFYDIVTTDHDCDEYNCELVTEAGISAFWYMAKFFFWWMLAPLCWVITYVGLKDQEV